MKTDLLASRHIGINEQDTTVMLRKIGVNSLDELINQTIPANIRLKEPLALTSPLTEYEFGKHIAELAAKNKLYTTYIGLGWYNTITPAVIQRNVFENPVWYTSYTPYQTEVSQGRLEALMNFQTAVCDLTAMLTSGRSNCRRRSRKHDVCLTLPRATESQCERSLRRREYFSADISCHDYTCRTSRHRTTCR